MELTKTQQKIIQSANRLFKEKGYEKTGVRDIAMACGLSVSNLRYHFPKKVQIMSEVYNYNLSEYYKNQLIDADTESLTIVEIMKLEYEFIRRALDGIGSKESYISSLRIPEVCNVYIEKSTYYLDENHLCKDKSRMDILMATTMMYGGLAQVLQFYEEHKAQYRLEELLVYPFLTRLQLLDIPDGRELINQVFE